MRRKKRNTHELFPAARPPGRLPFSPPVRPLPCLSSSSHTKKFLVLPVLTRTRTKRQLTVGQVTTELLCEMNPDVKGEYVREDPDSQMNKGGCGKARVKAGMCGWWFALTLRL